MTAIFAITTRGLEQASAQEMAALQGVSVKAVTYRRVEAECKDMTHLDSLRTVDDIFLKLDTWTNVGHQRAELNRIASLSAALDIEAHLSYIKQLRPVPRELMFSVTANFVGKRNYSAPEIKESVADGVLGRYLEWRYSEDDEESDLNLRVFIEHDTAFVGLRLFKRPLHRRLYKLEHLPGSLKPPVAAALTQLAQVTTGMSVLDAFCGGGTVLVEASRGGAKAVGGDMSDGAVVIAQKNILNAATDATVYQWDATQLPLASSSIDCAISNLPWGKQVVVDESLRGVYQAALREMQRVVKPQGHILLLTTLPELLGAEPAEEIEISLFGQTPKIVRLINAKDD